MWASHKATLFHLFSSIYSFTTFPLLFIISLHHNGIELNGVRVHYIQYADDLCIIAESEEDLQRGLDNLNRYCHEHIIEVNVSKTKVQIFLPWTIAQLLL